MLGILFTMPSVTSTLNGMGEWSSPLFNELWPYLLPILGISFIVLLLSKFLGVFKSKD